MRGSAQQATSEMTSEVHNATELMEAKINDKLDHLDELETRFKPERGP